MLRELVDTRFKLLCDEFTLKTKIRQNNENISFEYRSDGIFKLVSVSVHKFVHVVSNNTPGVAVVQSQKILKIAKGRLQQRGRGTDAETAMASTMIRLTESPWALL